MGTLFEKTVHLDPPQKLLIKGKKVKKAIEGFDTRRADNFSPIT